MVLEELLSPLLLRHPEVLGAIFCDDEGESMALVLAEAAGLVPYDIKVVGAAAAIWVGSVGRALGTSSQGARLTIKGARYRIVIEGMDHGYYLLAMARRDSYPARLALSLGPVAEALARECA